MFYSVPDYCEFLYSQAVIFPLKPCVSLEKERFIKLLTFIEQIDKYMPLRWKWLEKKTMKTLRYSENVLDVNLTVLAVDQFLFQSMLAT